MKRTASLSRTLPRRDRRADYEHVEMGGGVVLVREDLECLVDENSCLCDVALALDRRLTERRQRERVHDALALLGASSRTFAISTWTAAQS